MKIEKKLLRAILRTEAAYTSYVESKRFHQALRIFSANQYIYEVLCNYSLECPIEFLEEVFNYIFHLEDWFAQFESLMVSKPQLEDVFVFNNLQFGIHYPRNFKELLQNLK